MRIEEVYLDTDSEIEEYYIEHFGVKGMQWGVRKASVQKGAKTADVAVKTTFQDERVLRALRTGAIITAAVLTGGVGGMAVGALTTPVGSVHKLVGKE